MTDKKTAGSLPSDGKFIPATNETAAPFVAQICAQDGETEHAFCADPKGALAKVVAYKLADEVSVRPVRNTADEVNLVIPDYQALSSVPMQKALADAEMARVAGGEIFITIGTAAAVLTGISVGTAAGAAALGAGIVGTGAAVAGVAGATAGVVIGGATAGAVVSKKKKKKK